MFYNMRWHKLREPTLADYTYGDELRVEIFMSKAPEVKTLLNLDIEHFDIQQMNYRLEYTIMLVLALISFLGCVILLAVSHMNFGTLSDEEIQQLKTIEDKDPEMQRLKARKLVLQLKKEENRVNESLRRQERAFLREAFEKGITGQYNQQLAEDGGSLRDNSSRGLGHHHSSGVNTTFHTQNTLVNLLSSQTIQTMAEAEMFDFQSRPSKPTPANPEAYKLAHDQSTSFQDQNSH